MPSGFKWTKQYFPNITSFANTSYVDLNGGKTLPQIGGPKQSEPSPTPAATVTVTGSGSDGARTVGLAVGLPLGLCLLAALAVASIQTLRLRRMGRNLQSMQRSDRTTAYAYTTDTKSRTAPEYPAAHMGGVQEAPVNVLRSELPAQPR